MDEALQARWLTIGAYGVPRLACRFVIYIGLVILLGF